MKSRNTRTRLAKAACLASLYFCGLAGVPAPAIAADVGGSCCADLEERIAELEVTTVRKGNRRVTVSVYGQVNKAILWTDGLGDSDTRVVDNGTSGTRFGFLGEAQIASQWKAGYKLEFGVNDQPIPVLGDDPVSVRHSFWWVEGPVGKLSLGLTSMATDGIAQISVANVEVASRMLSLQPISSAYAFGIDLPFNDLRRNVVRYDSPMFLGFTGSASWSHGDSLTSLAGGDDGGAWDIALRYAGEFGGFRIAGGAGLSEQNGNIGLTSTLPGDLFGRQRVASGSLSVLNTGTGLFANVGVGHVDGEFFGSLDYTVAHLQGGWQKNVIGLGATTVYAEYAVMDIDGPGAPDPSMFGLGVVQALDPAAMDIYMAWRRYDLDDLVSSDVNTFMAGARIRF
jgi:predicted porin